jgi:hypothetical protein
LLRRLAEGVTISTPCFTTPDLQQKIEPQEMLGAPPSTAEKG